MTNPEPGEDTEGTPVAETTGGVATPTRYRRGRMTGAAIAAVVCLSVIIGAYLSLRAAVPADPDVNIDRVQRMLDTDGAAMEAHARLVLATADSPSTRCAPQAGAPPPTTPPVPIAGGMRVWCTREIDPTSLRRSVVEVDGVDPTKRCHSGATFVVFDVAEATWGTPYVTFSDQCVPISWYDGDPWYGRNFVPVRGHWYAVQPTGFALPGAW